MVVWKQMATPFPLMDNQELIGGYILFIELTESVLMRQILSALNAQFGHAIPQLALCYF